MTSRTVAEAGATGLAERVAPEPTGRSETGLRPTALAVFAYAIAMALVEAACVVYLRRAFALDPSVPLTVNGASPLGDLTGVEATREAATMVMLAAVGWIAGRTGVERLAWTAVAFGVWDIGYYGWLWVFIGWPRSLGTWDLLFLLPVPWASPVWAPISVSVALVGYGLGVARQARRARRVVVTFVELAAGVGGGALVVASFIASAGPVVSGGRPADYPWPVFVAGMGLAMWAATAAIRRSESGA